MTLDSAAGQQAHGLEVIKPGLRSLIQDLGRPGYARIGVSRSGAYDRAALRAANFAVANPAGAAGIEMLLGGMRLRARGPVRVALSGAPVRVEVMAAGGGRAFAEQGSVLELRDNDEIAIGRPPSGLRSYLALAGGIGVAPVLGSRSADTLSGLGPPVLRPADLLPAGDLSSAERPNAPAEQDPHPASPAARFFTGPHDTLLEGGAASLGLATGGRWTVCQDSDRVGLRLERPSAPASLRAGGASLPSEPALRGAIQALPSGQLVIFGPDAPVTGGYPVVGVVADPDLDLLAQLRPGETLALRTIDHSPGYGQ